MDQPIYYHNLSPYLIERYGEKVYKICLDGGFTCPNRDGSVGVGGCIFCGERGAGEHIVRQGVAKQISDYFLRPRKAKKFIAYFQNFTGTYAPVERLKELYDEATADEKICILSVGTRPDCVTEEVARLLASYKEKVDVWVELGLQTANDRTAAFCNRGYDTATFYTAMRILQKYDIKAIVHIMLGLPQETEQDFIATAKAVNNVHPFGVKIHSVYVIENTTLANYFRQGKYTPLTLRQYAHGAAMVLSYLSQEIVVHKITGDAPKDRLVAPLWNTDKNAVTDELRRVMQEEGLRQGSNVKNEGKE